MSNTANLDLERPDKGDPDWHTSLNSNFDKLDSGYGNNVASIADLPEIYIETGTFNRTVGDIITLPKSVDAINEYNVTITPTTGAGTDIGFIYVTKAVDDFTVYCTGNNTTDTYSATIYYIGDVASYGGSIYRRWYVSPDAAITDHGDDTDVGSLAWVLDQVGVGPAFIEFPGNKTYIVTANDIDATSENIILVFQPGAIVKPAAAKSLNVYSPEHIQAGKRQQIIDTSNNSTDPLVFSVSGTVYPNWFNKDAGDGTTECAIAVQAAINSVADDAATALKVKIPAGDYVISSTITLAKNLWIQGDGEGTFLDFSGLAVANNAFEYDNSVVAFDDCRISDLRIFGNEADYGDGGSGVYIDSSHNERIIVENCRIQGFSYGVRIYGSSRGEGPKVLNNFIDHASYAGIRLSDSQNALVSGNTIDGQRDEVANTWGDQASCLVGIWMPEIQGALGSLNNRIIGNTVYNIKYEGILIRGKYVSVIGNTVSDGDGALSRGIVVEPFSNSTPTEEDGKVYASITGNTISNIERDGISITTDTGSITQGVSNCVIIGNTIYNCGKATDTVSGIIVGTSVDTPYGKNNIISANIIKDCNNGIRMYTTIGAQISNNSINDCLSIGIAIYLSEGVLSAGNVIDTISAIDSAIGIHVSGGENIIIIGNVIKNAEWRGIIISDAVDKVSINNNTVIDDKGAATMDIGISISSDTIDAIHFNNRIEGAISFGVYGAQERRAAPALTVFGPTNLDGTDNQIAATLADGHEIGAIKTISLSNATNQPHTVTIAHHETEDAEVATFTAVDQYLTLQWTGTEWATLGNSCSF